MQIKSDRPKSLINSDWGSETTNRVAEKSEAEDGIIVT
jgi:hypothetical protein